MHVQRHYLKYAILGLFFALSLFSAGYATAYYTLDRGEPREFTVKDTLVGSIVRVSDGDTLVIKGSFGESKIRLHGVAAPEIMKAKDAKEKAQGEAAKRFLIKEVDGKEITCEIMSSERTHNRLVATCFVDGDDVAIPLVRAGLARACPAEGGTRYLRYEIKKTEDLPFPTYCQKKSKK